MHYTVIESDSEHDILPKLYPVNLTAIKKVTTIMMPQTPGATESSSDSVDSKRSSATMFENQDLCVEQPQFKHSLVKHLEPQLTKAESGIQSVRVISKIEHRPNSQMD